MITREYMEYLMSCPRKQIIGALKRNDHNGDYNGLSRTVAALTLLAIVADNEVSLEEMKLMF